MKTNTFLEKLLQGEPMEWKTLGEVAKLQRGRVISKQYLSENIGDYPVYSSQTANNGEIGTISTFDFDQEAITWTTDGANAGTVFHRLGKFSITNVCGLVNILDLQKLDYKFLFYWLSIEAKKYVYSGMGNPKLMSNQMEKIKIPIPPLSVQKEIARILDAFTAITSELTSELTLRQKQYQYYRDKLLTFGEEVEWKMLGEVCDYVDYRGKTPKKVESGIYLVTAKNIKKGFIDYEVSKEYVDASSYNEIMRRGLPKIGDVLITTEAPCGNIAQVDREDIALAQRVIKYRSKNNSILSNDFLKFLLLGKKFQDNLNKTATGSTVKGIKGSLLHKIKIPIPPIAEQKRIVNILDKFETLANSLSEGLPREIELRQKQYEYYRNLLLGFEK
ncbi:restriction endonuclease subunit S [Avibacterium paragallinarum]|uniref:Restriction endonuclease subunit S n=1 Tax=Avibacterium paragallinarum TaxID=728 RepID=A0AAE5TJE4_AVIPA|nr:restriction endonuclease subunit S [Avibacterium paragallinarum]MEE3607968.1 restriction endonuclease subunit S [Avibacterium paragallinarum]MEE3620959.1 restriction endonuclease subunit S [Avibacterium paragallinarum]MEE3667982.1 restriction endonuclease subunit S [Avibacterium paragallinarum]MEE3679812.1 restriction endonuclease subunit S [Avibacterium paragallinarum]MEE4385038.1 restriction endonuclease subunit S [Avibacterium paragallinarum]